MDETGVDQMLATSTHSITYRLGVDIGGTFTDLVLLGSDRSVYLKKVPSTPPEFSHGVIRGLSRLLSDAAIKPSAILGVLHGTTVAANAILEGRGAKTALVTTKGFSDVLELARMRYPVLYEVLWEKPKPLVPRRLRLELDFRINSKGELERPLERGAIRELVATLKTNKVESLAACFINSYLNPELERNVVNEIRACYAGAYVTASVDISPEIKEYERTSTAVVNAYIQPLVAHYVDRLHEELSGLGVRGPLLIMQSSGGLLDAQGARSKPVHLIESGPAAGVTATKFLARELAFPNVIAFDMGGTTAKASLIEAGEPFEAAEYEVGGGMNTRHGLTTGAGYTLRVPSIDISEVGAGGGSICWIDPGGSPRVGPQSAGAVPGPACYGAGGDLPTLTDAQVVLGYLNPTSLAGGAQLIQHELALAAVQKFAEALGLDVHDAAFGVCMIGVVNMSRAVKAVSSERGRDPRDFVLVAFGGAGPAYAVEMARVLGMRQVLIPISPGLFSSIGLLVGDVQHHDVRTYTGPDQPDPFAIAAAFADMEQCMAATLEGDGHPVASASLERFADIHYLGQSSELRVPVPAGELSHSQVQHLRERFDIEHERTYGHRGTGQRIEIANLRLRATVRSHESDRFDLFRLAGPVSAAMSGGKPQVAERVAYFGAAHGLMSTPVIGRADLLAQFVHGPLIVEDMDATTVVPPRARARRDVLGNIVIEVD